MIQPNPTQTNPTQPNPSHPILLLPFGAPYSWPKKIPWDADSSFCFSDFLIFFAGFATNQSNKYIKTYKNAAATATAAAAAATAAAAAAK